MYEKKSNLCCPIRRVCVKIFENHEIRALVITTFHFHCSRIGFLTKDKNHVVYGAVQYAGYYSFYPKNI